MFSPHHVHMDFIADNRHVIALAEFRHLRQFIPRPDLAGRILRAAQQHNFVFRFRQRRFQGCHIALPASGLFFHFNRHNTTPVTLYGFVKSIVCRGVNHHAVVGF